MAHNAHQTGEGNSPALLHFLPGARTQQESRGSSSSLHMSQCFLLDSRTVQGGERPVQQTNSPASVSHKPMPAPAGSVYVAETSTDHILVSPFCDAQNVLFLFLFFLLMVAPFYGLGITKTLGFIPRGP